MTSEWTRPDLDPRFVFLWRAGQDLINMKNPSYKGRSSLFTDELKHGNISLKLSKVKPADEGRYRCYIPDKNEEAFIDLVVASGAVSSPVISLSNLDKAISGVVLQCESAGWYPEPELLWLDGEGNLLSAGPTETLRGPDDLYTVSSRVTVEKRHSNNITCRVQQRNTNQSRETHIHVPGKYEYFQLNSSSAAPIIIGVVVSLALSIVLILIGVFFIWRRNKTNVWKPHCLQKKQETTKTEPDQEQETLMTQDIEPSGGSSALKKHQQLMEKNMKEEESSKNELEKNQHAAEEKLKEEHHHLQKKHAEISNMKKEEENQEADKMLKDDKKQDFQQEAKQPDITEVERPQNTPEHETPKRTNTQTFVATNQTRAKESAGRRPPAGTEQKPQESAVTSSQVQPAADCTTADRPLSPETQDPRALHTPTGAHQSQGGQTRPSSCQEEKHEADKKLKEDEKQDFQQEEKKTPTKEFWKQLEKNQHAAEEKLKEEHHHLEEKHAEISNMKKEDKHTHICGHDSNESRGERWMETPAGTEQKPQESAVTSSQTQPAADCTTADRPLSPETQDPRAPHTPTGAHQSQGGQTRPSSCQVRGEGGRNPYPDNADVMCEGMLIWDSPDKLKIDLISSTGERHRLK
ncbi:muscle M-line assembly protein unc-89 [Haplochromis burtoni]|uniref:muscle M-line assembly protein unc-89 n=1 Tax=Haplochromis burtoni TaxID=8153 RepID=UPI001C2D9BB6|nr:muscle M-line assembly protein unc-89 [Haplochromis burtoni]